MALLAMGVAGDQRPWEDDPFEAGQSFLDTLAEEVGGADTLDALDGTLLPEQEEFSWDGVPADLRDRPGKCSPPATVPPAECSPVAACQPGA